MQVINGKTDGFIGEDVIYIGRSNKTYDLEASPLANRFRTKDCGGSLDEVLRRYKHWIYNVVATKEGDAYDELVKLVRRYQAGEHLKLACWCKPKACHGDIIKQVVEFLGDHDCV